MHRKEVSLAQTLDERVEAKAADFSKYSRSDRNYLIEYQAAYLALKEIKNDWLKNYKKFAKSRLFFNTYSSELKQLYVILLGISAKGDSESPYPWLSSDEGGLVRSIYRTYLKLQDFLAAESEKYQKTPENRRTPEQDFYQAAYEKLRHPEIEMKEFKLPLHLR